MGNREIAPHQGREIKLVLDGKKPLASVDKRKDKRQYQLVLGLGLVFSMIHTTKDEIAFCLPENNDKLWEYWNLLNTVPDNLQDYQRKMGRLFGYSEEEIEAFVNGDIKCNCHACRGVSRTDD
jgi:hypothetical protein